MDKLTYDKQFNTSDTRYTHRNGFACRIISELGDKERDAEVGTMYVIEFQDGEKIDAFFDEISDRD